MQQFGRNRLSMQQTFDAMKMLKRSSPILWLLKRPLILWPRGTYKREAVGAIAGLEAMMKAASIKIAERKQAAYSAKVKR